MKLTLTIQNRQRTRPVDLRLLRQIVNKLLAELPQVENADLGIFLIGASEMTCLNETFVRHAGSTDVITFDYSPQASQLKPRAWHLHGEIFICMDEAILQARRFHTTWQSELVRYIIHGVLHLLGFDDAQAAARRKMKREEDRLLHKLSHRFSLAQLARRAKIGM